MEKHIPLRKCVSCGKRAEKASFIRVVRKENCFEVDATFKKEGRGAYVCNQTACVEKLIKTKGFHRSFRSEVPKELYDRVAGRSDSE